MLGSPNVVLCILGKMSPKSSSARETGCLRWPNLLLLACRILAEPLALSPYWKAKRLGSDVAAAATELRFTLHQRTRMGRQKTIVFPLKLFTSGSPLGVVAHSGRISSPLIESFQEIPFKTRSVALILLNSISNEVDNDD